MIDPTTLPLLPAGAPTTVGQQFTIRGTKFDLWPDDIVLGFEENYVRNTELPSDRLMKLVSKTDSELIFEVVERGSFQSEHLWSYFGAGLDTPRELLKYHTR